MFIRLRNSENIIIEADRQKIKVETDYSGKINIQETDKNSVIIEDVLVEKQIEDLIKKNE